MHGLSTASIPNSERKLDAARFFFERLEKSAHDPRAVYHLASAILFNCRAVLQSLAREHGMAKGSEKDDWSWYDKRLKQFSEDEQSLLRGLKELRDEDVHREGHSLDIIVDVMTADADDPNFGITGLQRLALENVWSDPQLIQDSDPRAISFTYHFKGLGPKFRACNEVDTIEVCRRCIQLVGQILDEVRN